MLLTFLPRPSPPRPQKRGRALTDVDGEYSALHKKKRRLRLFLITSRLSPEFSLPATNIVDRGSSKIAVWAKQKALGRNLLRKAAVLNRIRRQGLTARDEHEDFKRSQADEEKDLRQLELAKMALIYGSHDTHTRPVVPSLPPAAAVRTGGYFDLSASASPGSSSPNFSPTDPVRSSDIEESTYQSPNDAYACATSAQVRRRSQLPLPPSPLGLSNYDAFDTEEAFPNPYAHFDDDDEDDAEFITHDSDLQPPSAHASASDTSTSSTAETSVSKRPKTTPQAIYSDFSKLDPGEPVFGDYDQVDEGADAIWPNPSGSEHASEHASSTGEPSQAAAAWPASCSPNFAALLAPVGINTAYPQTLPPSVPPLSTIDPIEEERRKDREIKEERMRQRKLLFPQFHPVP